MTTFAQSIHDFDDVLEDLIETEARRSLDSDCAENGHSWQQSPTGYGTERLRCTRCKYAPHTPMEATR